MARHAAALMRHTRHTAAALLAATAALVAAQEAPSAGESLEEAFGEESRTQALKGWMIEVRER